MSTGWLATAAILIALELLFSYEAMTADIAGLERVFGVFIGLTILSFAALLFLISTQFYGWE